MKALLLVGAGGFVGSVARYLIASNVQRGSGFPIGTLMVNVMGCFAIGLLAGVLQRSGAVSDESRLLLMTGVLGGFTTFSAFGLETFGLFQKKQFLFATGNVVLSVSLGLAAVWLGVWLTTRSVS